MRVHCLRGCLLCRPGIFRRGQIRRALASRERCQWGTARLRRRACTSSVITTKTPIAAPTRISSHSSAIITPIKRGPLPKSCTNSRAKKRDKALMAPSMRSIFSPGVCCWRNVRSSYRQCRARSRRRALVGRHPTFSARTVLLTVVTCCTPVMPMNRSARSARNAIDPSASAVSRNRCIISGLISWRRILVQRTNRSNSVCPNCAGADILSADACRVVQTDASLASGGGNAEERQTSLRATT